MPVVFVSLPRNFLPPGPPQGFTATTISSSEIDLSWNANNQPGVTIINYYLTINPGNTLVQLSGSSTSYKNTGLSPSTTYNYSLYAVDSQGNTSPSSLASATTNSSSTGVKFHAGHYLQFDNSNYWTSGSHTPGVQRNNLTNFLASSYGQDNTISGVEIYIQYGLLDRGASSANYTDGIALVNDILSLLRTANQTRTKPLRLLLQLTMDVTQSASSTNAWPPWWVSNGYVVTVTGGGTNSALDLRNSNAVAACQALWTSFGNQFDSEPLLEMVSPTDETALMGLSPLSSSSATQPNYQNVIDSMATAFPHTMVRVNANFAFATTNTDVFFSNLYSWARANHPGHIIIGGPDPEVFTYGIDGTLVFGNRCGASACNVANYNSPAGNLRGIMPFIGHVEENGLVTLAGSGNQANPYPTGPSGLLNLWLNTNHAWHIVWNFEANVTSGPFWNWDSSGTGGGGTSNTEIAAIHSVSGGTLSGTPSEGTWNTN